MKNREIRGELKRFFSTFVDDLPNFKPNGAFGFSIQAIAGPIGTDGEESFDFTLCTPDWFAENMSGKFVLGRHFLFVKEYNYVALEKFLREYCLSCSGPTWQEVAEKIGRLGKWEFEDYVA